MLYNKLHYFELNVNYSSINEITEYAKILASDKLNENDLEYNGKDNFNILIKSINKRNR